MADPFVYKPPTTPIVYNAPQFAYTPYVRTPARPATPFIPDAILYPPSPYSRPSSSNRVVPPPGPERYAFPTIGGAYEAGYDTMGEPRRERLPSWHAPPPISAPPYGFAGPALATPGVPYYHQRRHSFSSAYQPSFESFRIHPLLNAEAPVPGFFFDLSHPTPEPLLYYGGGQTSLVPPEDRAQPVTSPTITRLRIISDALPREWAIEIDLTPQEYEYYIRTGYDSPPITVQAVLQELHCHMQLQVSHNDWDKLSHAEMKNVARAFTRRCRAAPGGYDGYDAEMAKGVRRVDYLRGKTRLMGLLKVGREDGWDVVKFITTDPYQTD